MTQRELERRVKAWQKTLTPLGIAHWRIQSVEIVDSVSSRFLGGTNLAGVKPSALYDHCWFQFDREWLSEADDQEVDETIIHEWLHVAFRDHNAITEGVAETLSQASQSFYIERLHHEEEGLIERLARTLYATYSKKLVQ